MLPTNYDTLTDKHPELRPVFHAIAEWVHAHSDWNLIDPRILSKDLSHISVYRLTSALQLLIDAGILAQKYMVVTPDTGVLAHGEYDDLDEIPEELYDRSFQRFDTSEADIVAVLTAPK